MNHSLKIDIIEPPVLAAFLPQLKRIYAAMDDAYNRAAAYYGFACDGCRDNCCRTRFFHHTLIEHIYLKEGLMSLAVDTREQVKLRARTVIDKTEKAPGSQETIRLMCPLNVDTRCILYPYRPMICRLHGIPHELKKPGHPAIRGMGCDTFGSRCGQQPYIPFDRTPVYHDMAKLEQEVKRSMNFTAKFRMTIAEMILDFHS